MVSVVLLQCECVVVVVVVVIANSRLSVVDWIFMSENMVVWCSNRIG